MILSCNCEHEYQDRRCGRGRRYHTETTQRNPVIYRCTVCRTERTESGFVVHTRDPVRCEWSDVVDFCRRYGGKAVDIGPPPKAVKS